MFISRHIKSSIVTASILCHQFHILTTLCRKMPIIHTNVYCTYSVLATIIIYQLQCIYTIQTFITTSLNRLWVVDNLLRIVCVATVHKTSSVAEINTHSALLHMTCDGIQLAINIFLFCIQENRSSPHTLCKTCSAMRVNAVRV